MAETRAQFHIGDSVRTTPAWHRGDGKRMLTGQITGFGREDYLIRVRRDGLTKRGNLHQPTSYHMKFWEVFRREG
jgi:hypothetical protein